MYTLHTRFCTFGADLCAQSVLINKNSSSELSRKFIKSALLVGNKNCAVVNFLVPNIDILEFYCTSTYSERVDLSLSLLVLAGSASH